MIHPWREREEKALEGEPEAIRLYTCSSRWPLLLTGEFLWQLCTLPPPNVNRLSSSTGSVAPFESRPSGSVDPLLSTRFHPVPSVGPFVWPSALVFFVLFSLLALFFLLGYICFAFAVLCLACLVRVNTKVPFVFLPWEKHSRNTKTRTAFKKKNVFTDYREFRSWGIASIIFHEFLPIAGHLCDI